MSPYAFLAGFAANPVPSAGPPRETRPQSISGGRTTQIRVDLLQTSQTASGRLNETAPLAVAPVPLPGLLFAT